MRLGVKCFPDCGSFALSSALYQSNPEVLFDGIIGLIKLVCFYVHTWSISSGVPVTSRKGVCRSGMWVLKSRSDMTLQQRFSKWGPQHWYHLGICQKYIFRPYPTYSGSEILEEGPNNLWFCKSSRWLWCMLKFENVYWSHRCTKKLTVSQWPKRLPQGSGKMKGPGGKEWCVCLGPEGEALTLKDNARECVTEVWD